jgi:hypothetical protein
VGGGRRLIKVVACIPYPSFDIDRLDKRWSVLC